MEDKKDIQMIIKEHIDLKLIEPGTSPYSLAGSLTIHGRTYSREWNLMQSILSLMCLGNIHDFGHSKKPTRLTSIYGTSSEPSPQYEQLHQDFERSQNYQIGFLMPSMNPGIITPI
ncbi:hypothetical protein ACS0TY_034386 [Phlomoides rotata]